MGNAADIHLCINLGSMIDLFENFTRVRGLTSDDIFPDCRIKKIRLAIKDRKKKPHLKYLKCVLPFKLSL